MRRPRKEPEPAPPSTWIRSDGGTPARLLRTTKVDVRGKWIYRLEYSGGIKGTQQWSLDQLLALPGVKWLKNRPKDWEERERTKPEEEES